MAMGERRTVTIDHCCLIDLEEHRPDTRYVEALIDAWRCGRIDLAVCAIGATENTKDYFPVETYDGFRQRLRNIGLGDVPEILPFARWGLFFWGHALWGDDQTKDLERRIWEVLFPNCEWKPEFNRKHAGEPAATFPLGSTEVSVLIGDF